MNFLDNYRRLNTNYRSEYLDSIHPKDYSKEIRVKSPDFYYNDCSEKPAKNPDFYHNNPEKILSNSAEKMLINGCEHWQSTYNSSIVDPYSKAKSSKPEWSLNKPPYTVESRVGPTEYATILGGRGTKPTDKLDKYSTKQPRIEDTSKYVNKGFYKVFCGFFKGI